VTEIVTVELDLIEACREKFNLDLKNRGKCTNITNSKSLKKFLRIAMNLSFTAEKVLPFLKKGVNICWLLHVRKSFLKWNKITKNLRTSKNKKKIQQNLTQSPVELISLAVALSLRFQHHSLK
jgi:hypothetical protein